MLRFGSPKKAADMFWNSGFRRVRRLANGVVLLGFVLTFGQASPARAQQLLRTIDLGTLDSAQIAIPAAVSPNGTVAGRSVANSDWANTHVFIWRANGLGMVDLGVPGIYAQVYGVSDVGVVVGSVYDSGYNLHVFLAWEGGSVVDSRICPGYCDRAGINAGGTAVGAHLDNSGNSHAFTWSASTGFVDLPTPPGRTHAYAFAINDLGQVAGRVDNNAALWTTAPATTVTDLGRLSDYTFGTAINNAGEMVGLYGDGSGNFLRAFRWSSATGLVNLTGPNVVNATAVIAQSGLVSGQAYSNGYSTSSAFMYTVGAGFSAMANPSGAPYGGAVAVDSFGLATGSVNFGSSTHAAAWQSCESRDVHPAGYFASHITAANEQSFAVGYLRNEDYSEMRAYAWEFVHPPAPPAVPCAYSPAPAADADGDGVADDDDAFPEDRNETTDTDGDGVGDNGDVFRNSNMNRTVSVGACATSVANQVLPNGATFNDLIASIVAANHGAKVSAVSQLSNGWKSAGLISGRDHGAIVSCIAKSK